MTTDSEPIMEIHREKGRGGAISKGRGFGVNDEEK